MSSIKNQSILKALLLTTIFASFSTKAQAVVVDHAQNTRVSLGAGESVTITSTGSITGIGNPVLVDGVAADFVLNEGSIISGNEAGILVDNGGSLNLINNTNYTTNILLNEGQVTTIKNSGDVANIINLFESSAVEIDNSGLVEGSINMISFSGLGAENINNSGTIGGGIFLSGGEGGSTVDTINNSGTIINGISVANFSHLHEINNSGVISQGEGNAINIASGAFIGQVTNSGLIIGAEGGNAMSFANSAYGAVVNLNPGSHIIGNLAFSSSNNDEVNIGSGHQNSATYYYTNQNDGGIEVNHGAGLAVISNFISDEGNGHGIIEVVDPSSFAIAQDNSLKSSIDIGNLISDRLTQARADDYSNTQLAQNGDSAIELAALNNKNNRSDAGSDYGMKFNKFNENQPYFWSEVFGSYNERSSYKNQGESESSTGGMIFGVDKKIASNQRLGGFVGVLDGASDINKNGTVVSTKIDSKGLFAGGYLSQKHRNFFTDFSVIAGINDNNSDRVVYEISGPEIAQAQYNSVFITPSATIGKNLNTPVIPTIVSATLRYTGQWVQDYQEVGTTNSNIAVDNRYLNTVSTRLKIETNNKSRKVANGNFKFNVRTGLEANHVIGNQNVDVTVLGETVSVDPNNRDYNIDGFVGFNTSYDLKDNVRIYADVEGTKGLTKNISNNNLGLYGKLGLKWGF